MLATSMTYLGIPGYVVFWGVFIIALGLFIYRMYQLIRLMSLGRRTESYGQILKRVFYTAGEVLNIKFSNCYREDSILPIWYKT